MDLSFLPGYSKDPVLVLAPMAGVTDWPFRKAVHRCTGTSFTVCEMIASQSLIRSIPKTLKRAFQGPGLTAVQLAGNDPDIMAQAASMIQDIGACFIDINMGCPVKKIAINSYAGSALMRNLPLAQKIFQAMRKAVDIPITVKMRKGWDEDNQNALELLHIAKNEGLSFATVHGRTRNQLFSGKADWDFILQAQAAIDFPVVANGDISTPQDAKMLHSVCAGVMIGRGAYGRPWIFKMIKNFLKDGVLIDEPSPKEQAALILEHYDDILSHYGLEKGMPIARKHLGWYSKGLPSAAQFRQKVFQETDPCKVQDLIVQTYHAL